MVENSNRRAGANVTPDSRSTSALNQSNPAVLDRVLQSRVPPIRAVAMVPLSNKNGPSDGIDLIGWNETKNIRQPGKGFDVAVVHAHATTHSDVVARQLAVLDDGYETQDPAKRCRRRLTAAPQRPS